LIRWIQDRKWLSLTYLSLFGVLFLGGIDLMSQGYWALLASSLFSLAILALYKQPWLTVALLVIAPGLAIYLGLSPLAGVVSALAALFVLAMMANPLFARVTFGINVVAGTTVAGLLIYSGSPAVQSFGIVLLDDSARLFALAISGLAIIGLNSTAFLCGRYLITRHLHVGTPLDRAIATDLQSQLALELAEQTERFEIARDINELIIQKVSAVISQAEGGLYAAKADINSSIRTLERLGQSARAAHTELRRLFDMLNRKHTVTAAPPRIKNLEDLVVAYREFGYSVSMSHEGVPFRINSGAELAVYRIVVDALENVKQHCPVGTDVSIAFSWVDEGLQVLVKDNGVEVSRRADLNLSVEESGYTADDDLRALIEPIKGASITAMRERAALYGGSIEATQVPGVGFTLSAIFPRLKTLAASGQRIH
jgi:signal transduction histidine kinase